MGQMEMETGNGLEIGDEGEVTLEQVKSEPSYTSSRFQKYPCNFCQGSFTSELELLLHFREEHYYSQEGLSSSDESDNDDEDGESDPEKEEEEAGRDLMDFLTDCERALLSQGQQEVSLPNTDEEEGEGDDHDVDLEWKPEEDADDIGSDLGNDAASSCEGDQQTPDEEEEVGSSHSLDSGNGNGLTNSPVSKCPQRGKTQIQPKVELGKRNGPKCQHCSFIAINKHNLARHMKVHDAKGKDYKCSKCNSYFVARSALVSHERALHGPGKIPKEKKTEREVAELFILQKDVEVVLVPSKNAKTKPKKLFKCKLCGALCRTAWHARSHIQIVHWKQKPFKCTHCSKSFGRNYDLKVHRITVHVDANGGPPISGKLEAYECPEGEEDSDGDADEIDKESGPNSEIRIDEDDDDDGDSSSEQVEGTGDGAMSISTDYEGASLDEPDSPLLLEEEEDPVLKPDEEEVGDIELDTENSSNKSDNGTSKSPKKVQVSKTKFQGKCPYCSYAPRDKRRLDKHMEVHKKQGKNLKCSNCNSYFTTRAALLAHVRSLHGKSAKDSAELLRVKKCIEIIPASKKTKNKRLIKCKLCGKNSAQPGNAYSHVRIVHWKQLPWKCEQCPKRFGINRDLKLHRLNDHADGVQLLNIGKIC